MNLLKQLSMTIAIALITACGGGDLNTLAVKSDISISAANLTAADPVEASKSPAQSQKDGGDNERDDDDDGKNKYYSTFTVPSNTPVTISCKKSCTFVTSAVGATYTGLTTSTVQWKATVSAPDAGGTITVLAKRKDKKIVTIVINVLPALSVKVTGAGTAAADGSYTVNNNTPVVLTCNMPCTFPAVAAGSTVAPPVITATTWAATLKSSAAPKLEVTANATGQLPVKTVFNIPLFVALTTAISGAGTPATDGSYTVTDGTTITVTCNLPCTFDPLLASDSTVGAPTITATTWIAKVKSSAAAGFTVTASAAGQTPVATLFKVPAVVIPFAVTVNGAGAPATDGSYSVANNTLVTVTCTLPCTFDPLAAGVSTTAAPVTTPTSWTATVKSSALASLTVTASAAGQTPIATVIKIPTVVTGITTIVTGAGVKATDGSFTVLSGTSVTITCATPCSFTPSASTLNSSTPTITPTSWTGILFAAPGTSPAVTVVASDASGTSSNTIKITPSAVNNTFLSIDTSPGVVNNANGTVTVNNGAQMTVRCSRACDPSYNGPGGGNTGLPYVGFTEVSFTQGTTTVWVLTAVLLPAGATSSTFTFNAVALDNFVTEYITGTGVQ
jgi:hypothetical protein